MAQCVAQEAKEFNSIITGELPAGWEDSLPTFTPEDKGLATRLHSQTMLNALASAIPGTRTLVETFSRYLGCLQVCPFKRIGCSSCSKVWGAEDQAMAMQGHFQCCRSRLLPSNASFACHRPCSDVLTRRCRILGRLS